MENPAYRRKRIHPVMTSDLQSQPSLCQGLEVDPMWKIKVIGQPVQGEHTQTNRLTQPNPLSPCLTEAIRSIINDPKLYDTIPKQQKVFNNGRLTISTK